MAIANDISIDYVNKIVQESPTASGVVYSVNALYSYLMDVFDELTQMDDKVPMSAQTPTSYTMINGWYIQEELVKYLSGGAIQTDGYDDEIHTLTLSSGTYVNCITGDVGKQVEDDSAAVGALLDYSNTDQKWWVRTGSSTPIADNSVVTISGGTGAGDAFGNSIEGEHIFANPYTLGTLEGTPQLYIFQNGEKINPDWWGTGHFDILIKVSESNVAIDSRKIVVFGRNWTDTSTVFEIVLTTAGQNAVPLGNADDLNNQNTEEDIEDLQDGTVANIAVDFSFAVPFSYDIKDGAGVQDYEVQVDCNNRRLSDVYEVCKFWLRSGSTKQLETGADGVFMDGEEYRYADTSYSEVVPCSLGTFAGGKFFAARSVYFVNLHGDDAQAFQLIDKTGTTRNPPNYQAFTINGVVVGDRAAIFLDDGVGGVNKTQYDLDGANPLNKIAVTAGIPIDTPAAGTIIVVGVDGTETVYTYTSWNGNDFVVTVAAAVHDGTETAYVPYILEEASATSINETSTIYTSDRAVICIVRKKGVLPFETTGTYSSTGYSTTAIRTVDSVVT